MIDHDQLKRLCSLLDDPVKGMKDTGQRQDVLQLVFDLSAQRVENYKQSLFKHVDKFVINEREEVEAIEDSGDPEHDEGFVAGMEYLQRFINKQ